MSRSEAIGNSAVIPAKAGIQTAPAETLPSTPIGGGNDRGGSEAIENSAVIPAKAGIQTTSADTLNSRFRGNDEGDDAARLDYVLRVADSSLILGHRLSEWCGHGPVLEEDIALANIALDLIGQARSLYTYAGSEGGGRSEDSFAFGRVESEFRNVTLVELPNGDYGCTILRNFLFTAFQRELWAALQQSTDTKLGEIAAKAANETRYHVQHSADWTIRLGDGTAESHTRMQGALDALWPYTAELFSASATDALPDAAGLPMWSTLEGAWNAAVRSILDVATLRVPPPASFLSRGKEGEHSGWMGALLAEMQSLQREYPDCKW